MSRWTNPFGDGAVSPAEASYAALALTADVTLVWPFQAAASTDTVAARLLDVTPDAGGRKLIFPDARRVSPGYDFLVANRGAFSFVCYAADGVTALATVAAGAIIYLYLTDNSTANGTWRSATFGATTHTPDAASLAGYGIAAAGTTLQRSSPVSTFSASQTLPVSARGGVWAWTGGAGTLTLPAVALAGSDFEVGVSNQGSGALTIDPNAAELIDGAASIVLQPGESCEAHCGGTAWYTVGRGRSTQFTVSLLSKSVSTGTVILSVSEAANIAQKYTGALIGNVEVVLPSVVQIYYVSNQTSGAFTLTFKTGGVGSTVTVPQGQNAVLLCDSLNVINNATTVSGISSLTLSLGSVGAPSINFSGDTDTGIYQTASGNIDFSTDATRRVNINSVGINVLGTNPELRSTDGGANGAFIRIFANNAVDILDFGGVTPVPGSIRLGNTEVVAISTNRGVTLQAPAAGDTLTVAGVSGGRLINASASLAGVTAIVRVGNDSNTANSDALLFATTAGALGGDAFARFNVSGVTDWSVGLDNSDSDKFVVSCSPNPGTNNALELTTARAFTFNAQTAAGGVTVFIRASNNNAPLRLEPYHVSDLPAAATAGQGAMAYVDDATGTTFHAVPVGGGANGVLVVSDGGNWRIGG